MRVQIDESGMVLELETGDIDPTFSGVVRLHYQTPFSAAELATLPAREFSFDVPREYMLQLVGLPIDL